MRGYFLSQDTPLQMARGGSTLHVVNHPAVDYVLTAFSGLSGNAGAYVLIGFDHVPAASNYDAIAPPFSESVIPVPDSVRQVFLVWPSARAANLFVATSTLAVGIGWEDCEAAPSVRPVDLLPLPYGVQMGAFPDASSNSWQPSKWTLVLDQAQLSPYKPHLRPVLAPSAIAVKTGLLVANTVMSMPVAVQPTTAGYIVLKQLIISTSGAGLVVVGTNGLTVGSPGVQEVVRINAAGAGVQPPIDFGEGLNLQFAGQMGVWKYYASTAITVDITAILG